MGKDSNKPIELILSSKAQGQKYRKAVPTHTWA
jgi:hypothetical protein